MNPAEPIQVEGAQGWQEKPIAYLVLRAMDESADHIPALQMDLNLMDASGPVVLPVRSTTVLIDAVDRPDLPRRTSKDLIVTQTLDMRSLENDEGDRLVKLEVTAVGRGVVPALSDVLDGLEGALAGYKIADDGIDEQPISVAVVQPDTWRAYYASGKEDDETYIEPDEDGLFRLTTSRSWTVTYEPGGGAVGDSFRLPVLVGGLEGTVRSERYVDMDLVPVSTSLAPINATGSRWPLVITVALLLAILGGVIATVLWRRGAGEASDQIDLRIPERVTPLTAVVTLRRMDRQFGSRLASDDRTSLRTDIEHLERTYFAEDGSPDGDVKAILDRWVRAIRGEASPRA